MQPSCIDLALYRVKLNIIWPKTVVKAARRLVGGIDLSMLPETQSELAYILLALPAHERSISNVIDVKLMFSARAKSPASRFTRPALSCCWLASTYHAAPQSCDMMNASCTKPQASCPSSQNLAASRDQLLLGKGSLATESEGGLQWLT
jgi:hypothetical protein